MNYQLLSECGIAWLIILASFSMIIFLILTQNNNVLYYFLISYLLLFVCYFSVLKYYDNKEQNENFGRVIVI